MKKILTVLIMVFGLSSMLHAVAYDAKNQKNCRSFFKKVCFTL